MNTSTLTKRALGYLSICFLVFSVMPQVSFAHCGGKHTGNHPHCGGEEPPPPPPEDCSSDKYPGTVYENEGKRREASKIFLTSEDGCLPDILLFEATDDFRGSLQMYWDGVKGIIIWAEEPGDGAQYILQYVEFTLDGNGDPDISQALQLNLFPDDEYLPPEDQVFHNSPEIWGKGSFRYIIVDRLYADISEETGTSEFWLFDISDLSVSTLDSRMIFNSDDWDCSGVLHPETTAACYGPDGVRWNPSGTRFYLHDNMDDSNGVRWDGIVRMDINQGVTLSDWTFGLRELVGTSALTDTSATSELGGQNALPDSNDQYTLPVPEYLDVGYFDFSGRHTEYARAILNADYCVGLYSSFAGTAVDPELWFDCVVP